LKNAQKIFEEINLQIIELAPVSTKIALVKLSMLLMPLHIRSGFTEQVQLLRSISGERKKQGY